MQLAYAHIKRDKKSWLHRFYIINNILVEKTLFHGTDHHKLRVCLTAGRSLLTAQCGIGTWWSSGRRASVYNLQHRFHCESKRLWSDIGNSRDIDCLSSSFGHFTRTLTTRGQPDIHWQPPKMFYSDFLLAEVTFHTGHYFCPLSFLVVVESRGH